MTESNDSTPKGFSKFTKKPIPISARRMKKSFSITTLEGKMKGKAGDWLIIGVKGEKYPCADDIFRASYYPSGKDKCSFCEHGGKDRRPCDAYERCTFDWKGGSKCRTTTIRRRSYLLIRISSQRAGAAPFSEIAGISKLMVKHR